MKDQRVYVRAMQRSSSGHHGLTTRPTVILRSVRESTKEYAGLGPAQKRTGGRDAPDGQGTGSRGEGTFSRLYAGGPIMATSDSFGWIADESVQRLSALACRAQTGETALADGRHGHPSKLRGAARSFLEEQCRQTLPLPSSALQAALRERFDLQVSVSQINRVRAALGVRNQAQPAGPEKKQEPPGLLRPT
jgi:hypothetical protein